MVRKATSSAPSQRMLRVGELVRHALSDFFMRREILDPIIEGQNITVPEVRMTPDLMHAKCFIMPLGGGDSTAVVEALNKHKKFIRGRIVPAMNLKFAPELRFLVDETFAEADRIDALLRSEKVKRDLVIDDDDDGTDD